MVDIKLIIIGVLVLLCLWQYSSPDKSHDFLEPYIGGIADFIDLKNPLNSEKDNETTDDTCATHELELVCGSDGITYDNVCYAMQANVTEMVMGEC